MLRIRLLGQFDIRHADRSVVVQTRPGQAVLAYLLLNAGTPQRRDRLSGLFWPDASESNARNNLRHVLWRIRKAIGDEYLLADNFTVMFDAKSDYWLDTAFLESALDEAASVDQLTAACTAFGGDLLPGFYDDWVVLERERYRAIFEQLSKRLLDMLVEKRWWDDILKWGERWVALGQAPETVYRALMVAYAELEDQASVAAVYRRCVGHLRNDLDVEPSRETQALYERLSSGERLTLINVGVHEQDGASHRTAPASLPAFLSDEIEPPVHEQSVFVERTRELSRLEEFLEQTRDGRGQVVFVTGSAGRGKTSLLNEFARQAQTTHADLLVASGSCSAYAGGGDPYLPFRDVMAMLTGAVEAKWMAGVITRQGAQRLWRVLPEAIQALLDMGPDLIDTLIPGSALVDRAQATVPDGTDWLVRLQELAARGTRGTVDLEQSDFFEQYVSVLERLAARHPLLITLDDLQWADTASISLLFHLGRRIGNSRILIVGAYRPEETGLSWDGSRHPLQKVLGEFRRTFGDNQVDLASTGEGDGRRFVDVFLDTQPNLFDEEFRLSLFRQTGGHPLFTVELLRAMRERGDLVQDQAMRWMAGPALDWGILPARVEAVIEERIGRLDARLHGMLSVASVEGEVFTAEVVARVQGLGELQTHRHLSQELSKRHRLVREVEEVSVAHQPLSRYQFSHILFQRYLYEDMASGERRQLHVEIARALEELYEGRTEEIAAQLLHHYREAEMRAKAIEYARLAARRAVAVYAYEEATQYLQIALDLLENGEQDETRLALLEELADVYRLLRQGAQALSHLQAALDLWSSLTGIDDMIVVRLHRKIVHTISELRWHAEFVQFEALARTLETSRAYLESNLILAEDEPPQLEWVLVLDALATETGIELGLPFDLDLAESYALAAVKIAEELDAPLAMSHVLGTLADIQLARGRVSQYVEVSYRRLAISHDRRFSDVRKRIVILDSLGNALILAGEYPRAMPYLVEAESLAAQIGAVDLQISALNLQALCCFRLDRWDEILEVDEKRQELEQRYSRERIGPSCIEVSICAATLALRGDFDVAKVLREQAYAIQVHLSGEPSASWVRVHYY